MTNATLTAELLARYDNVTAATAHEAMGRKGALDSAIKPIRSGIRVIGPAFTCVCAPGDNLTLHAALKMAQPGDVLVCDATGATEQGMFGDVMASCGLGRGAPSSPARRKIMRSPTNAPCARRSARTWTF